MPPPRRQGRRPVHHERLCATTQVKSIEVDELNGTRRACEDFGSFSFGSGIRGAGIAVDLTVQGLDARHRGEVYSFADARCAPNSYLVGSSGVIDTGRSVVWTVYPDRTPTH